VPCLGKAVQAVEWVGWLMWPSVVLGQKNWEARLVGEAELALLR
jgi:hypothetical protein